MPKTLTAIYDGQHLLLDEPLALEPNRRYIITVQGPAIERVDEPNDAWKVLEALQGTVDAPPDWAVEHDHYLYGLPNRRPDTIK
ncbi:MAG: hypothetical protein NZM11_00025 [Anaerolineales bacterium]|nr:hypothetical protein [Anaerolineales bacterium]